MKQQFDPCGCTSPYTKCVHHPPVSPLLSGKPRSRLSASHVAVRLTIGYRQGMYVEYSVECSKCCALNGIQYCRQSTNVDY
eukprot:1182072-Prorocentrum_minimum.AAC.2